MDKVRVHELLHPLPQRDESPPPVTVQVLRLPLRVRESSVARVLDWPRPLELAPRKLEQSVDQFAA